MAELPYYDEEIQANGGTRDPVLPIQPPASTKVKKSTHRNARGPHARGFRPLLEGLATRIRNACRMAGEKGGGPAATMMAMRVALQQGALELLGRT